MRVSSKLRSESAKDKAYTEHGCGPCNKPRCSWCLLMGKTTTFIGTNQADRTFDILHTVNSANRWLLFTSLNAGYVSYNSWRRARQLLTCDFNLKNPIKRGFSGCELTEHFLHSSRTHIFERHTKITIIEEIKRHGMHIEREKEKLRTKEVFWQKRAHAT